MAMISIKNLNKNYNEKEIYKNFNLEIADGEILAILGESGGGKTTLINILAGLTDFSGEINGIEKPISMVFQKDMLIKNLSVKDNLLIVNKNIDVPSLLNEFGLSGQEHNYIKNLSAGMARRVAILRALIFDSDLILLDEPFINLDLSLKISLMDLIKEKKKNKTMIFVTHDIKEAVYFSDRIVILDKGKIVFDIQKQSENSSKLEEILFEKMTKKNF